MSECIKEFFNSIELEKKLGYRFKNRLWLEQALVHSSYAYECSARGPSNERLEFLGDAILNLIISDSIVSIYPAATEGMLSRRRASLVNARHLARIARSLNLGSYLLLGKGEESQAGRRKPSVLADALEALIAAVYLDGGYEAAREVVKNLFRGSLDSVEGDEAAQDFKTVLQEYVQKRLKVSPEYRVLRQDGPAHDRTFEIEVRIAGEPRGRGEGKSKKEASQAAAQQALRKIQKREGKGNGEL